MQDRIVESVINKYLTRSKLGFEKYNATMDRNDLSFEQWLTHAQEEAMDLSLYLEKIKFEFEKEVKDRMDIKNKIIHNLTKLVEDQEKEIKELRNAQYNAEKRFLI